jgi:hypothetical protein
MLRNGFGVFFSRKGPKNQLEPDSSSSFRRGAEWKAATTVGRRIEYADLASRCGIAASQFQK